MTRPSRFVFLRYSVTEGIGAPANTTPGMELCGWDAGDAVLIVLIVLVVVVIRFPPVRHFFHLGKVGHAIFSC